MGRAPGPAASAGADLSYGLAVGLVAAYVSFMFGGAWAFAGSQEEATFYGTGENENSHVFKYDQLPGSQGTAYPDLQGASEAERRRVLYDKMACDAVIAVQTGLLRALPLFFAFLLVIPAVEALAAGRLWRRLQRPWPVIAAYAERIVPLAMVLILSVLLVTAASRFQGLFTEDGFRKFQGLHWMREVLLVALAAAEIATWRRWSWPLRLLLHAAWIGFFVYMGVAG